MCKYLFGLYFSQVFLCLLNSQISLSLSDGFIFVHFVLLLRSYRFYLLNMERGHLRHLNLACHLFRRRFHGYNIPLNRIYPFPLQQKRWTYYEIQSLNRRFLYRQNSDQVFWSHSSSICDFRMDSMTLIFLHQN